jgi:hypothetical protein
MSKNQSTRYWLFQASPKVFRLKSALRLGVLKTFAVTSHKDKIKAGDKVILWQSGKQAACCGLASITAAPVERMPESQEIPFFTEEPESLPRVSLEVEYNLWNQPLDKTFLEAHAAFGSLKASLPGTNFTASREEYQALENLIREQNMVQEPEVAYGAPEIRLHPLNLILYGPPGTGKTYLTVNHALSVIEGRPMDELLLESRAALRMRYGELVGEGRIAFVSFHQSFSYEDFVEGIKPVVESGQINYKVEWGLFRKICDRAMQAFIEFAYQSQTEQAPDIERDTIPQSLPSLPAYLLEECPRYVLIIDEINRGNVPSIFGELISLLEADKRAGQQEAIYLQLPYSKETFSVPPNLYVIATMNTTDRSTEVMDIALRRRFAFKAMPVQTELVVALNAPMAAGIDLQKLLLAMNSRIQLLLGRDYAIGHAYLLGVHDLDGLKTAFKRHIIPLLEEYFFSDYGKIGLVLGSDFVKAKSFPPGTDAFSDFEHTFAGEFAERTIYELRPLHSLTEQSFIRIYENR